MIKRNKLAVFALTSTIMFNSNYAFADFLVDREAVTRDVQELTNGTIQPLCTLCNWAKENSWYVDKFKEVAELENPLDLSLIHI